MAGVSGGPWGLPKSRPASCCANADEMAGATAATLGPQKEGCAQRTGPCKLPAQECSQHLIALYPPGMSLAWMGPRRDTARPLLLLPSLSWAEVG